MTDKFKKYIRLIYGIVLSVMLVITGFLLISSCISIYSLGDRPFTVENISAAFAKIKIPVFITLGAMIVGAILQLTFPKESDRIRSTPDKKKLTERLEGRVDPSACDESTLDAINAEKRLRITIRVICAVFCVAVMIPALVYIINANNFSLENYNESVIAACLYVIPCSLMAVGALIALSYLENASYDRQIKQLKSAIASGAKKQDANDDLKTESRHSSFFILGARIVILAVAVLFIIEGISNGGMSDVLIKAINICTECIGLG